MYICTYMYTCTYISTEYNYENIAPNIDRYLNIDLQY